MENYNIISSCTNLQSLKVVDREINIEHVLSKRNSDKIVSLEIIELKYQRRIADITNIINKLKGEKQFKLSLKSGFCDKNRI